MKSWKIVAFGDGEPSPNAITYGVWQLQFSFYALGSIDLRKNKVIRN
jgi:hypothetical protein